jgi:hypothetical protein
VSEREGGAGGRFFFFPGHLSLTLASHAHTHTSAALAFSAALLAATTATPLPAFARNATAAAEAAAARKAALKAAIENAKATGKDAGEPEAFQSSASVPEDHSPNSHSHQEEGAKTSGGG